MTFDRPPDSAETSATENTAPDKDASTARPLQVAMALAAAFLLSRIIGLVQLRVISASLDTMPLDAYFAAFRLPDAVNYLVAGGAMSVTFIPIFISLKDREPAEAWRFFSTVATLMTVALGVILALCFVFAHPLVHLMNPGFSAKKLDLTAQMTRIMLPTQLFFYLGGMLVGVLNAHKRFGASGMTSAVYNAVAIVFGFVLWILMGSVGFAWGITLGALCGGLLLPLFAVLGGPRAERPRFRPSLDWRLPAVKTFFRNALPIMLGVSLPIVDQQVVGLFASYLDDGHLSYLQLGNRVMIAPLSILAQAASVAAFPFLATDAAQHNWGALAEFVRTGLRRLIFLSIPLSMLLVLNATPIIKILFGSPKFLSKPEALPLTAIAFALYCVGLFAWAGQQFVARGLYALQDTVTPTLIGSLLTVFFFIPLCWAAAKWGRVPGLAAATSIGACAHFVCVLLALEAKLRRKPFGVDLGLNRIWGTMLRTATATAVMAVAGTLALFASRAIPTSLSLLSHSLLQIAFVSLVSVAAFGAAAQRFRIPEWTWFAGKITARIARRGKR